MVMGLKGELDRLLDRVFAGEAVAEAEGAADGKAIPSNSPGDKVCQFPFSGEGTKANRIGGPPEPPLRPLFDLSVAVGVS